MWKAAKRENRKRRLARMLKNSPHTTLTASSQKLSRAGLKTVLRWGFSSKQQFSTAKEDAECNVLMATSWQGFKMDSISSDGTGRQTPYV